jgi:phosphate transport system protein
LARFTRRRILVTHTQAPTSFHTKLGSLKGELVVQGRLVQRSIEDAVEAIFERRPGKAAEVIERDHEIDRVDVRIEKGAVQLMVDEWGNPGVKAEDLRMVLTIVKVNNEFERIGDLAAVIAEKYDKVGTSGLTLPGKFRVMANSVIGIMHNTNTAFAQMDVTAAQLVLASDDATDVFRTAVLRDIEDGLVKGIHTVDYAFALGRIAHSLARMADHCTNVAEQVIYVATGKIVRHQGEKWTGPQDPGA